MASNKNTTNSQTSEKPSKEAKAKPVKAVKPKTETKSAAAKKPSAEKKAPVAAKDTKSATATKAKAAPAKKAAAKKASVEKVMKGSKSQAKKTTSHKAKTSAKGPISIEVVIAAINTAKNDYAEYHQNAHQNVFNENAKNGAVKQLHHHQKGLASANEFSEYLSQQDSLEELMDELRKFLGAAERSYYPHSFASYVSASLAEINVINPHHNKRYSQEAVVRELRKWVNTNLSNQQSRPH